MSTSPKSQYILFLRHPPGGTPPPEELQRIMAKFAVWIDGLKARGEFAGTNGLEPAGRVIRPPRGTPVSDGPYIEAKEIVGGYLIVNADSLDDATAIAQGCPGIDDGLIVEVRPIRPRPA